MNGGPVCGSTFAMTAWHPTRSVVDLHALDIQGFEIPKAVLFTAKKVAA